MYVYMYCIHTVTVCMHMHVQCIVCIDVSTVVGGLGWVGMYFAYMFVCICMCLYENKYVSKEEMMIKYIIIVWCFEATTVIYLYSPPVLTSSSLLMFLGCM
jgi:hypothetical protein